MHIIVQSLDNPRQIVEIGHMIDHDRHDIQVIEHGTAIHDFRTFYRKNTGRDYGAFVWFILQFYDTLQGEYIFTSANIDKHSRRKRLHERLSNKYSITNVRCRPKRSVRIADHNYQCEFYATKNGRRTLVPAKLRPFGRWFEHYISPMHLFYQSGEYSNSFIVTDADTIRSRSKQFWEMLLRQLDVGNAPEVGHYLEKASAFLFHPRLCKNDMWNNLRDNGWCAAYLNDTIPFELDLGKKTRLQNNRTSHNIRNRKKVALFLLQHVAIRFIVTTYLNTDKIEVLLAQDIQIDSGRQPVQQFHRDHRYGSRCAVVVAFHTTGGDIGTLFADNTHTDYDDESPCTENFSESCGNLVIYDPYMYHAGKATTSDDHQSGRIFTIFVPTTSTLKRTGDCFTFVTASLSRL